VARIVAIELLAAAQGLDFRRQIMPGAQPGCGTAAVYELVRKRVPFVEQDEVMYPHMDAVYDLVKDGYIARAVNEALCA
jgi:histidine ammonia-lyase